MNVIVFFCVNCVDVPALRLACQEQGMGAVTFVSLPCSGKLGVEYLLKAVENGGDAVFVLTCPDHSCRFLEGSLRAGKRAGAVDELLDEAGLGRGRIRALPVPDRETMGRVVSTMAGHLDEILARFGRAA